MLANAGQTLTIKHIAGNKVSNTFNKISGCKAIFNLFWLLISPTGFPFFRYEIRLPTYVTTFKSTKIKDAGCQTILTALSYKEEF